MIDVSNNRGSTVLLDLQIIISSQSRLIVNFVPLFFSIGFHVEEKVQFIKNWSMNRF